MLKIANKCILPNEDANNVKNHSLTICHISAIVLLSWPYPQKKLNKTEYIVTNADFGIKYMEEECREIPAVLENEIKLLHDQLSTIFQYHNIIESTDGSHVKK